MSDLQVPEQAYKRRIQALELEMTQIDERKELVCLQSSKKTKHIFLSIYIYLSIFQTAAKKRKEKEKVHIIIDKLNEELLKQKEHVERVRARLGIESGQWFKNRMFLNLNFRI